LLGAPARLRRPSGTTRRSACCRADRQDGGQRRYDHEDIKRLTSIRRCRDFGLPIEQLRSLVTLVEDLGRNCLEARDLAQDHLIAVRAKLGELEALERNIARFVASCETACAGSPSPECTILEDLVKPFGRAKVTTSARRQRRQLRTCR
jgi:DNA-binding transcriptional MerR regulator